MQVYHIYTCIMYVQTVIVFCEVNMSCLQNVASILVLEDRCRKGFRNISGTLTVILKFCWNTSQFFVRSRLLIKVCVRTIFEALRRRSPDNGLLVKKSLAQFGVWEEANLESELTLPVYCNCKLIHEHLSCDGFEVYNSRWHIAVCSWKKLQCSWLQRRARLI